MQSRVVTSEQAGHILGVSRQVIWELTKSNKIKNIPNIQPHKVFYVDELLAYAEKTSYSPPIINGYIEDNFLIFESKINC